MFVRSAEKGWLVHEVLDTFATLAGLVYGVTHIVCWAENGRAHGRDSATFKRRCLETRTRNLERNIAVYFKSVPIDGACDASSLRFPFKMGL